MQIKLWSYFNSGNIPDQFTANRRLVKTEWNDMRMYMEVGYPNKPF
jgi:hypothetical protein